MNIIGLSSFYSHIIPITLITNRLHQRGGKTLKERTRLNQVELRLSELDKYIASKRRELTQKPL